MAFLGEHGDERTKATLMTHGAREPFFGVKVADPTLPERARWTPR
jgi:hypothetical protein